jgi:UDP-glucose:(heptosyl)LPS alpha-1,3-glucosyltransferase
VIFTGPREDVDDFYAISDIFLLPTHYEPFSNVVLEAMNFENVVFTTRQNGASELLDKRFIMDSPKDNKVVKSIDNLLSNETNLKEEQIKNREKSKLFSIEENLNKTLEVINDYI